eukprot:6458421-Amphidinium_carterae.1
MGARGTQKQSRGCLVCLAMEATSASRSSLGGMGPLFNMGQNRIADTGSATTKSGIDRYDSSCLQVSTLRTAEFMKLTVADVQINLSQHQAILTLRSTKGAQR